MRFVIVGYGRVGNRTANILESEGHEAVVIERDAEKVQAASDAGFEAYQGDGSDERVLERADLDSADALGALSGDLNANFAACMIAKRHGCRTVMRIDEDYRQEIYERYAADVDEIVYPERLGAAGAKTALLGGDLNVLADLTEHLTAATVEVSTDSPHVGRRVVELKLPRNARVYAHGRVNEPLTIPLPQTVLEAGDRLAVIAEETSLDEIRAAVDGEEATAS